MRTLITTTLSLMLIGVAPLALADHGAPSISGSYVAGTPAWLATDACDLGGTTDGIDSSCVALPADVDGHTWTLTVDSGITVNIDACFWDADGAFMSCGDETVPEGAAMVSVGSIVGANVSWTMSFE